MGQRYESCPQYRGRNCIERFDLLLRYKQAEGRYALLPVRSLVYAEMLFWIYRVSTAVLKQGFQSPKCPRLQSSRSWAAFCLRHMIAAHSSQYFPRLERGTSSCTRHFCRFPEYILNRIRSTGEPVQFARLFLQAQLKRCVGLRIHWVC